MTPQIVHIVRNIKTSVTHTRAAIRHFRDTGVGVHPVISESYCSPGASHAAAHTYAGMVFYLIPTPFKKNAPMDVRHIQHPNTPNQYTVGICRHTLVSNQYTANTHKHKVHCHQYTVGTYRHTPVPNQYTANIQKQKGHSHQYTADVQNPTQPYTITHQHYTNT